MIFSKNLSMGIELNIILNLFIMSESKDSSIK